MGNEDFALPYFYEAELGNKGWRRMLPSYVPCKMKMLSQNQHQMHPNDLSRKR